MSLWGDSLPTRLRSKVRRCALSLVMAAVFGYGTPARAEPVLITGGSVGSVNGIDLPGFTLTGSDSSFFGVLMITGSICCVFSPGDRVALETSFPIGVAPGQPPPQLVNGTRYPSAFLFGELVVKTVPFIAPPINGDSETWVTTPFDMRGQLSGYADFGRTMSLFSVAVTGGGMASLYATVFGNEYIGQSISYRFQDPSPTPEPASVTLFTAGLLGFYARSRLRARGTGADGSAPVRRSLSAAASPADASPAEIGSRTVNVAPRPSP
jgi:PEP-CTERM motif-containing protein